MYFPAPEFLSELSVDDDIIDNYSSCALFFLRNSFLSGIWSSSDLPLLLDIVEVITSVHFVPECHDLFDVFESLALNSN